MKPVLVGSMTLAALLSLALGASAQRPRGGNQAPPPPPPPRYQLGELFPPPIKASLNLTADQSRQLADLEAETKAKLERILTAEQREQLQTPRPPGGDEDEDHGRPVAAVARELGVTPEQFRAAFRKVNPARPGEEPTREQRQRNRKVLSEALGVSPERLDQVMDKYRPGGRGTNGPEQERPR